MVANIVSSACSMLHLVSLSVLSAANAQLVECQTLDQWILYKHSTVSMLQPFSVLVTP